MRYNALMTAVMTCAVAIPVQGNNRSDKERIDEQKTDTALVIDEVEVISNSRKTSALKIDVPAKYIPVSSNTITAQTLQHRNITDIQTASRYLPGVRIRQTYGAFQQISVRGFDHSIIMLDGVRDERSSIDNSYPFMDLSAVQRIELIKGPQSVLYGTSAVGGVVNVVRKAPTAEAQGFSKLAYGSWNNINATIGYGGKFIGPFNYLAMVNYQHTDGWRDNERSRRSGYLTIAGNMTDKDELTFRLGGQSDTYATEIGLPPILSYDVYSATTNKVVLPAFTQQSGLDKTNRYNSHSDFMKNKNFNLSLDYKHIFGDYAKLSDRLSYSYDDIDYFGTESLDYLTSDEAIYDTYYMSGEKKKYICIDSIYYSYPLRFSHIAKTLNNQLELSGEFYTGSVKHNYLAGYSLIYLRRCTYKGYNFKNDGTDTPETSDVWGTALGAHGSIYDAQSLGWMKTQFSAVTPQIRLQNGFYLHDVLDINEHWKAMLSARFDLYSYKNTSLPTIGGKRDFEDISKSDYAGMSTKAFTYKAGVVYLPVENLSIYASYGTYFKPIYTLYNPNTIYIDRDGKEFTPDDKGGEVFKPEEGGQFEFGLKYEINPNLTLNASVFTINKYNMNVNLGKVLVDDKQKTVTGQVGRMRSTGFDLDITWEPVTNMSLTTGYGFTDAKYKSIANNEYMKEYNLEGNQFAYTPRNTFYFLGDYTVPTGAVRGLGFNVSVSWQDKVYRNTANDSQYDGYWITDLGISYEIPRKRIRLGFNVNNLFNTDYFNQSLGNQFVPSEPTNYMASVSYKF